MNILWHSVPPQYATGYGTQTKLWTKELARQKKKNGEPAFNVIISAITGNGPITSMGGFLVLPNGPRGSMGNDYIESHCKRNNIDVLISMFDTHVADCKKFKKLPWLAWQVIDSTPLVTQLVKPCETAKVNMAMSRFGQKVMKGAGFSSHYVPLGIDTEDDFYPVDRDAARKNMQDWTGAKIKDNTFVVVMNSANMSRPPRKNFGAAFSAFADFLKKTNKNAILYCHTETTGQMMGGDDIRDMASTHGLTPKNLYFPNQYEYVHGMITTEHLRNIYSAADVFLHAAMGEGFGLPIVEAQACGCPVVAPKSTSMTELVEHGTLVSAGVWWQMFSSTEQFIVDPAGLHAALTAEYLNRKDRQAHCLKYDIRNVYKKYLGPLLKKIETGEIPCRQN